MRDIVLATLNAKWAHASLGLRYLMASLGELRGRAALCELTLADRPADVVERLLAFAPRVIGLGVYVWNAAASLEVVAILKRLRPDVVVVLGGPEVSHELEEQEIVRLADYVVTGEGEEAFRVLCSALLAGERPAGKVRAGGLPDLGHLPLPYALYDAVDVAQRVLYVEASRGCPYRCEFCLSALDEKVRAFPLEGFLAAMQDLLDRGALHFKFVDRTFNLSLSTSRAILEFFLSRLRPGLFLHFEMVPDRMPLELRELLSRFPPRSVQLEIGIQTFDPAVGARISRRQDLAKVEDNFAFLRGCAAVHVHADLIVGLPGESLAGFGGGFDRLVALGPQEIQIGILKRLRGAPIARHDAEHGMVYAPTPPYEVLRTDALSFAEVQRLRRLARVWELVANSGRFARTLPLVWGEGSPFAAALAFADWLHAELGRTHAIALERLASLLRRWLVEARGVTPARADAALAEDLARLARRKAGTPRRQAAHAAE